jgi:hypothetical protein
MKPDDIGEARQRRAKRRAQYVTPFKAMIEKFEASWRAAWARHCAETDKTISFEEWFYATDENGVCPFEVAGGWFSNVGS